MRLSGMRLSRSKRAAQLDGTGHDTNTPVRFCQALQPPPTWSLALSCCILNFEATTSQTNELNRYAATTILFQFSHPKICTHLSRPVTCRRCHEAACSPVAQLSWIPFFFPLWANWDHHYFLLVRGCAMTNFKCKSCALEHCFVRNDFVSNIFFLNFSLVFKKCFVYSTTKCFLVLFCIFKCIKIRTIQYVNYCFGFFVFFGTDALLYNTWRHSFCKNSPVS